MELDICQVTEFQSIVLWNSQAKLCTDLQSAHPTGGTDPASIFQDNSTKRAFEDSEIVVFVTDGDIGAGSVTQVRTLWSFTKADRKSFSMPRTQRII